MARKIHPWALGISIVIVVFLILSIGLTIIVSQEEYHLVQEDYYEKDQGYQEEIDSRKRTGQLDAKPEITVDREAKSCTIQFPERERYDGIGGDITFFRIDDAAHDTEHALRLNDEGKQHISVSGMQAGQWIVKLRWNEGGEDYYLERRVYLQQ